MRPIKLKGKSAVTGEWIYGAGVTDFKRVPGCESGERKWIFSERYRWCEIKPETVELFIGQKDSTGKDVYKKV